MQSGNDKVNLATFFAIWAEERRWDVPDIHWRAVHWLEHRGNLAVLRCFRGFGKSTLLAIYNAWRYYRDPSYRILHQGDQDKTAFKTSRDTRAVLQRHPLTRDWASLKSGLRGEASFWWVNGADDERNPSMQAAGITSNVTSSRCDEAQNDDVEVPRNIQNPEARDKMRYRLSEQTHCMVPGARQLFIGTPHTHDSLYDEQERMGADCLTIPMFAHECRIDDARATSHPLSFRPEFVFSSIGETSRALVEGEDWWWKDGRAQLRRAPGGLLDFYAGSAWPERFTAEEMVKRRKKCKTVNEWDSQYQLHSKPLHQVRLDPEKIKAYDCEPSLRYANGDVSMWLGGVRIAGASAKWDPAGGKLKSDVSSLSVVLQDEQGRRYWHRAIALTGDVAEMDDRGEKIIGGQVYEIAQIVKKLHLPRVVVETNGAGTFAPVYLKSALQQARLQCGVTPLHEMGNKNRRILEAIEAPLTSGTLWAHVSVLDGPAYDQMREWNPAVADQPDDHLDSLAGAISQTPERISRSGLNAPAHRRDDWRPNAGIHEVELEG